VTPYRAISARDATAGVDEYSLLNRTRADLVEMMRKEALKQVHDPIALFEPPQYGANRRRSPAADPNQDEMAVCTCADSTALRSAIRSEVTSHEHGFHNSWPLDPCHSEFIASWSTSPSRVGCCPAGPYSGVGSCPLEQFRTPLSLRTVVGISRW